MSLFLSLTDIDVTRKPIILNHHLHKQYEGRDDVLYIGRKADVPLHFGNPWSLHKAVDGLRAKNRIEAILNYRAWLRGQAFGDVEPERRKWILDNLGLVRAANYLMCFCAPRPCHGTELIDLAFEKA